MLLRQRVSVCTSDIVVMLTYIPEIAYVRECILSASTDLTVLLPQVDRLYRSLSLPSVANVSRF